jgi:conjugal transfer pilin signal peptidase TrbI
MTCAALQELEPADVARVKAWRLGQFRRRLLHILAGFALVMGALYLAYPYAQLSWNTTNSLPGYVFVLVKTERPGKGDMAAFWPPANPYYPASMWFTKIVVGGPGDVISHQGREVFINGKSFGMALEKDSKGRRALAMQPDGVIPPGRYFVWTPHPHSYDSRYTDIGLVADEQIRGRAYRLF